MFLTIKTFCSHSEIIGFCKNKTTKFLKNVLDAAHSFVPTSFVRCLSYKTQKYNITEKNDLLKITLTV